MSSNKRTRLVKPKAPQVEQPSASNKTAPIESTPVKAPTVIAPTTTPSTIAPAPGIEAPVVTSPGKTEKQKGTRTQTNKAIGVNISAARVRRHIDSLGLNAKIDAMIAEPRAIINEYKTAEDQLSERKIKKTIVTIVDGKEVSSSVKVDMTAEDVAKATAILNKYTKEERDAFDLKVKALSCERTRFSDGSAMILAIVCDELVKQLVDLAMKQVLLDDKKIVQIYHLHKHGKSKDNPAPGIESLTLYPLIGSLPLFIKTAEEYKLEEDAIAIAKEHKQLLAQAEKEFRKKYGVKLHKKKAVPTDQPQDPATATTHDNPGDKAIDDLVNGIINEGSHGKETAPPSEITTEPIVSLPVPEQPSATDDAQLEEEENDTKTSFKYYIYQTCKDLTSNNAKYSEVRTSPSFREYISELLINFIRRICPLIALTAKSMGNKTVNDLAIYRTIKGILIDGNQPVETIEYPALITDPVILGAEKLKVADAKKNKIEYSFDIESIPKILCPKTARRVVTYPESGYSELRAKIKQKMIDYNALKVTPKQEVPAQ